ncbi:MAG: alkaline phosphatase D family protein [Planctomycetota bacterium]
MKTIKRRTFAAIAAALSFPKHVVAQKTKSLNGYSPGSSLSKIDGLDLLNLWGEQPERIQKLYAAIEEVLSQDRHASFAEVGRDQTIQAFCRKHDIKHLGGPMLGCVTENGAKVWVRTTKPADVEVRVKRNGSEKVFGPIRSTEDSDLIAIVPVTGLKPSQKYSYRVFVDGSPISLPEHASISTLPDTNRLRLAFGTCPHRWGLGNQKQADLIRLRQPSALMIYGDVGAQDKNNHFGKHRCDYQIRDFFPAWQSLSSTIPVYTTWDDHDYFDNDRSGIPKGYVDADRKGVLQTFRQAWINPRSGFKDDRGGVFFRTRLGPCDVIMLDNRYFRTGQERGFLGDDQTEWLKEQLLDCKGPFVVISCGTMWTDHISNGKDSWGKYDPEGREELFQFIEENRIPGVLLLSGDRHGASVFRIPRPSGHCFYEFEPASLGGRTGPAGKAKRNPDALFAVDGKYAFGEFTFDATLDDPSVTFQLIHEDGGSLFQLELKQSELTPA